MMSSKRQPEDSPVPLKYIRETVLGKTQFELAQAIGMNPRSISLCETGKREPQLTFAQFKKLAKLLESAGISLDDLPDYLGRSPEKN